MKSCNISNNKWEDKGIILGIISYLLLKYKKLINKTVYLPDTKIRAIISFLFKKIQFTNKKSDSDLIIRVRSIKKGDLYFNNINNLKKISVKSYRLLPYYDNDNPMIMYNHGDKKKNISDIEKKINKITCKRGNISGEKNNITDNCFQNWDTNIEYEILEKYSSFFNIDIKNVYELINNYLLSDLCCNNNFLFNKLMPKVEYVEKYIPIPFTQYIEKPVKNNKTDYKVFIDLIGGLNEKLSLIDNNIEKKIEYTNK
jgi:hypothetical protein